MNAGVRKPIQSFALTQCTYNQPTAAIEAYGQFLRQSETAIAAAGQANLVIIDSSLAPSKATAFYEAVSQRDERVTYLHIPTRPEYENERLLDLAQREFPLAYRWRKGEEFHAAYASSMPNDEELRQIYIEQDDVREILQTNGPNAYENILRLAGLENFAKVTREFWTWAVDEIFNCHEEVYPKIPRPHLSNKRQVAIKIATAKHCDIVVHLDDDWVGNNWVKKHKAALATADITGLKQYSVMIQTADMENPTWAVADLTRGGTGYVVGFDGKPERGAELKPSPMQGWSLSHRINGALPEGLVLPEFAPILYGEDRIFLRRAEEAGFKIAAHEGYDSDIAIRGIYGHSSSHNSVNAVLEEGDERMPSAKNRAEAQELYTRQRHDFSIPASRRPELPKHIARAFRQAVA